MAIPILIKVLIKYMQKTTTEHLKSKEDCPNVEPMKTINQT